MLELGNITIDGSRRPSDVPREEWNGERYESAVRANVERVLESRVGSIVLEHLIRPTTVRPEPRRWDRPGARSLWSRGARAPHDRTVPQTGAGAQTTVVTFTPAKYVGPDAPPARAYPGLHPFRSDAVLLHELFHSVEAQWGTIRTELVGPVAGDVVPVCEHRGVRVTNMYRSETLRPLRGPYAHYSHLTASGYRYVHCGRAYIQNGSRPPGFMGYRGVRRVRRQPASQRHDQYVGFEQRLIGELMLDLPTLTEALERIPRGMVQYNPFQDFWSGTHDGLLLPAYWSPPSLPPSRSTSDGLVT